jgi:hypothetical protein
MLGAEGFSSGTHPASGAAFGVFAGAVIASSGLLRVDATMSRWSYTLVRGSYGVDKECSVVMILFPVMPMSRRWMNSTPKNQGRSVGAVHARSKAARTRKIHSSTAFAGNSFASRRRTSNLLVAPRSRSLNLDEPLSRASCGSAAISQRTKAVRATIN